MVERIFRPRPNDATILPACLAHCCRYSTTSISLGLGLVRKRNFSVFFCSSGMPVHTAYPLSIDVPRAIAHLASAQEMQIGPATIRRDRSCASPTNRLSSSVYPMIFGRRPFGHGGTGQRAPRSSQKRFRHHFLRAIEHSKKIHIDYLRTSWMRICPSNFSLMHTYRPLLTTYIHRYGVVFCSLYPPILSSDGKSAHTTSFRDDRRLL